MNFSTLSVRLAIKQRSNTSVERTAQKLRFRVPSLQSAAPHVGRWGRMMMLSLRALVVLLLVSIQPSVAIASQPFVMGMGRYLTGEEQTALLDSLQNTGSEEQRKKFQDAFHRLVDSAQPSPPKIEVVEFTKLYVNTVFSKDLRKGERTYMVCFNCEENIPPQKLAERKTTKSKYYGIWVLSAEFMVVQQQARSGEWRMVLDHGAAE